LFHINNFLDSHLWRNIKNYRHLGSKKEISTGDNTINPTWTNRLIWNHLTQMILSGARSSIGDIGSGLTSMVPLTCYLLPSIRVMCYLSIIDNRDPWRGIYSLRTIQGSAQYNGVHKKDLIKKLPKNYDWNDIMQRMSVDVPDPSGTQFSNSYDIQHYS
jgi:hypothetical protein